MATWTQPAVFIREADTDIDYGERSESFSVRFRATGRCEVLADGTKRFVHGITGTEVALPAIGDIPAINLVGAGSPTTYTGRYISNVSVRSYDNADSLIVLTISPQVVTVTYATPAQTDELEWVPHQDPIEAAPRYRAHLLTTTTYAGETLTQGSLFKRWKDTVDSAEAKALYAAMSTGAKELADRYAAGLREYDYFIPVVRRTDRAAAYASGAAGAYENPTPSYPSGYVFRKSASRSLRQGEAGTWETVAEWSGYNYAYTDLETPL